MTDEQIIKALEYCSTDVRENTCPKCAFYKKHRCSTLMLNAVSDLINRQKAEIERLREKISYLEESIDCSRKEYNMSLQKLQQAKSEAIREFAERLKKDMRLEDNCEYDCATCYYECKDYVPLIDNLVREMTEVQNERTII